MTVVGNREVEVKLPVTHLAALRRRLARLGARPAPGGRVHERNTLYDTPQGGLAKHGQLLRVRVEEPARKTRRMSRARNSRAVLTFKGPAERDTSADPTRAKRYKVRQEYEVEVADPEKLRLVLEGLGLRGWFRYEKYRASYTLPGQAGLTLALDETPIGAFLELEGPPQAIDRVAKLLGYTPPDYVTKTYLALHLERCRKQRVAVGDMLFPAKKIAS